MGSSYAVSWKESGGASDSGRLELGPHCLRLEEANSVEIAYVDVTGVSVGRGSGDRLGGRTSVVVSRRDEHPSGSRLSPSMPLFSSSMTA